MPASDLIDELDRLQRVAPYLSDPQSRDALKQYYLELEAEKARAPALWRMSRAAGK